ncbi:F0F1 ATP synthase subunit delta [Candidatus Parcubacteria bacterium]|nr:F0F1 ATP synthase subunit delta [Candidatus Parcubacteria bacterium]
MKFERRKLASEIARRMQTGQPVAHEVAAYLIDSGKTSELNSLLRDVTDIRCDQSAIIELTATSAFPLSSEQISEIESLVKKRYPTVKQVVIHNELNPDVIGGISLSLPGASLDLTIRAKLNKLRTLTA